MNAADIPTLISVPFALDAGGATRSTIPPTTVTPGRASWHVGFSGVNMEPIASGGIAPFGQDMNGVLYSMSVWLQWLNAGGPLPYSAAFSSIVGGYPQGAVIMAAGGLGWWLSLIDANTSDPDTGGSNWQFLGFQQVWAGDPNGHVAGVAATAASSPSLCWDSTDGAFWVCTTTGNAASAVWQSQANLVPVNPNVTGTTKNYTRSDFGQVRVRNNTIIGANMVDTLPTLGSVANGWWTTIINGDPVYTDTVGVPTGRKLNGLINGTVTLSSGQSITVNCDVNGDYWLTVPPIPTFFTGQAIYITTSGTYPPGLYDLDSRGGPFTFTMELLASNGDNYQLRDVGFAMGLNNVTLNPNGRTIDGIAGNQALNVNGFDMVYSLTGTDWSPQ